MDLSRAILGPVLTEKAERQKLARTYTLRVDQNANKIDIQNALRMYYGVEVQSIRVLRVRPKTRNVGMGKQMEKRHRSKRMIVTITKDSPTLDLVKLRNS
jgi:ribosomal protein L23